MSTFCENCGQELPDGAQFCENCGTAVDQGAPQDNANAAYQQDSNYNGPQQGAPYQQTGYYQGSQQYYSGGAPQAPKKSPLPIILTACIVGAAVIVAAIFLFKKPNAGGEIAKNSSGISSGIDQQGKTSSAKPTKDDEKTSSAKTSEKTSSAMTSEKTSSGKTSADTSSAKPTSQTSSAKPDKPGKTEDFDYSSLSVTGAPAYADFNWFWDGVYYNGAPSDRKVLTDYSALLGSWKGYVFMDPDNKMDMKGFELSIVTFGGTADFATASMQCHVLYDEATGSNYMKVNEAPLNFNGEFKSGKVNFTGDGMLKINDIYTYNGREFALGEFMYPSGEGGPFALVRP